MRHCILVFAGCLALMTGCDEGVAFRISVEFPDGDALDQTRLLRVYAIECAEDAACKALVDYEALPDHEGYPVEARLEIDMQGPEADWRLSGVGPGRRLFYAEAEDSDNVIILAGCTDIEAGGGGEQEVKIVLTRVTRECMTDVDCDDDNPCTRDRCEEHRCVHENLPEGTPCEDDGTYCNGEEECNGQGFCVSLGNPCPRTPCNNCQEDTDSCYDPAGGSCDDGRYCNGEDTCDGAGTCVHSGDPCPDADCRHCNEVDDACADPEGTPCTDDGRYCTGPEECDGAGHCASTGDPCPPGDECNRCNETDRSCLSPQGASCGDASDTDCTDPDSCDGAGTCRTNHEPPGAPCGDGSDTECTDPDACDGAGTCRPNHESSGAPCEDGQYCNGADTCDGSGGCAVHTGDPCAGGTECNRTCNETADNCLDPPGTPCGDGSDTACTDPDTCDGAGRCDPNHESFGTPCDDGQYCNGSDSCDGSGGCTVNAGNPCPPGDACNQCNDAAGSCHSLPGTPCDDGQYCNGADTCDGSGGCTVNAGDPCASGPECNRTCSETADNCLDPPGTPCGDGSDTDCTDPDTCDGAGICDPNHEPSGTPCEDGQYCNGADTCDGAGACAHAGSPCPETECKHCQESTDGCCDPAGTTCEDGLYCTESDACDGAGQCTAGTLRDCSFLDGQCATGRCDDGVDSCVADTLPDWTECDDGNPDTFSSVCLSGVCLAVGPVADTNQRVCYEVDSANTMTCWGNPGEPECGLLSGCGQDAQYGWDMSHGPDERFGVLDPAANGEEVVMDWVTGLQWQRSWFSETAWEDARNQCWGLVYAGYDDWRLPERHELFSLADYGRTTAPPIDMDAFPGTPANKFWTATESARPMLNRVWIVDFTNDCLVLDDNKSTFMSYYGRCVRGNSGTPTYQVEGTAPEETVLDQLTGLMWQRTISTSNPNWEAALLYCEGLVYAGYEDWRLPDIKELDSLVDDTRYQPAIDPDAFGSTSPEYFWSSTSTAMAGGMPMGAYAKYVNFFLGDVGSITKTNVTIRVRCVRAGPW